MEDAGQIDAYVSSMESRTFQRSESELTVRGADGACGDGWSLTVESEGGQPRRTSLRAWSLCGDRELRVEQTLSNGAPVYAEYTVDGAEGAIWIASDRGVLRSDGGAPPETAALSTDALREWVAVSCARALAAGGAGDCPRAAQIAPSQVDPGAAKGPPDIDLSAEDPSFAAPPSEGGTPAGPPPDMGDGAVLPDPEDGGGEPIPEGDPPPREGSQAEEEVREPPPGVEPPPLGHGVEVSGAPP